MTILVDTGSPALIKSTLQHHSAALTSRPIVVIDHHATRSDFGFKTIDIVSDAVATAEQVAAIAIQLGWPVNEQAANKLVAAIVSDSLNLTTSGTTVHTIQMVAYLMERGASLYEISRLRRETSALDEGQVHLKGQLLSSTRFEAGGRLAIAEIPPDVVAGQKNRFEPYNMIISDMQWASGVEVAAVFKNYGTKINVPLRSKNGLAGKLAEAMGGGGHANAGAYRCDSTDIAHEIDKLITQFEQVVKDHDALS